MSLTHEYGIGHANEMGTEPWRINAVKKVETTMPTYTLSPDPHKKSRSEPTDLRDVAPSPKPMTAEDRQAAVDTVIAYFGDDTQTATQMLVMLDLVA